jgi:hypothetical protein
VVACCTVTGEPDGTHLSVEEWFPRWDEWLTGIALCGQSAEQGTLPPDTPVTCQDCEGYRDTYERALAGRPTAEQEELAALRRKLARIEQMADAWQQQFPDNIRTAAVVEALRIVIQEQP